MTLFERVMLDRQITMYANKLANVLVNLYDPRNPYAKNEDEFIYYEVDGYSKIMQMNNDVSKNFNFIKGLYSNFSNYDIPEFNLNVNTIEEKSYVINFWLQEMFNNCNKLYRMSKTMDFINF